MEFLVEKITDIPETLQAGEVAAVRAREAAVVAEMLGSGALRRLWRSPASNRVITIGLWEARGENELNDLLNRLPMRPWMRVQVRPLSPHPNERGLRSTLDNCLPTLRASS